VRAAAGRGLPALPFPAITNALQKPQKKPLTTGADFDKNTVISKRLDTGRGIVRPRTVFGRQPDLLEDMNSKCRKFNCGPDLMMGLALHRAGNK